MGCCPAEEAMRKKPKKEDRPTGQWAKLGLPQGHPEKQ